MLYETRFLLALITTWVIEIPVLIVLIRFAFRNNTVPVLKIIGTGVLCTALTLPYLWFILPPFVDAAYYIVIGETLVFLAEAVILNLLLGLSLEKGAACSFVMNLTSFLLGLYLL